MPTHKAWPGAHQASGHHSNTHRKPVAELPILNRFPYTCFSWQKFIQPVFKDPQGWRFHSLESTDVLDHHKFFPYLVWIFLCSDVKTFLVLPARIDCTRALRNSLFCTQRQLYPTKTLFWLINVTRSICPPRSCFLDFQPRFLFWQWAIDNCSLGTYIYSLVPTLSQFYLDPCFPSPD